MDQHRGKERILVSGWPLLPPAATFLLDNGMEIVGTGPDPDSDEMIAAIRETQPGAVIVRSGVIDRSCFNAADHLRAVSYHGAGYDVIDVIEASKRGIPVFAAPGRNAISVAEHAIALLLAVRKQILSNDRLVRQGNWRQSKPATGELHGNILGLIGLGSIGEHLSRLARAFGMEIFAFDPQRTSAWPSDTRRCETLDDLLDKADVVSLHVPLTAQTKGMIDARALAQMKQGAILINTARGGIVDETALVAALEAGHLYGAGIDTFDLEPPGADAAVCRCDRVVLSPHIAGVTPESTLRMSMCCAENIFRFLRYGHVNSNDLVNPNWRNNAPGQTAPG